MCGLKPKQCPVTAIEPAFSITPGDIQKLYGQANAENYNQFAGDKKNINSKEADEEGGGGGGDEPFNCHHIR